jgi:predicted  nucleic acid-binding Zn-ribbon protein
LDGRARAYPFIAEAKNFKEFLTLLNFNIKNEVNFMPVRSRMIKQEIEANADSKMRLEEELKEANSELERLQKAILKGTANTDALVAAQIKVNTIQQTITVFDSQFDALVADLIVQRQLERRKEIFSKISLLDDEAEKLGNRFTELYAAVEQLSYARFAEMASIIANIEKLKAEFGRHIVELIPNVSQLKSRILPEVEHALNNTIAELQENHCKLSVLRATGLGLRREYPTDLENAFRLPTNALDVWIWVSIRAVRENELQKQQIPPTAKHNGSSAMEESSATEAEKTGFFQRIFS